MIHTLILEGNHLPSLHFIHCEQAHEMVAKRAIFWVPPCTCLPVSRPGPQKHPTTQVSSALYSRKWMQERGFPLFFSISVFPSLFSHCFFPSLFSHLLFSHLCFPIVFSHLCFPTSVFPSLFFPHLCFFPSLFSHCFFPSLLSHLCFPISVFFPISAFSRLLILCWTMPSSQV